MARTPWWIPPFLGRAPDLEPRLVRLLGLVALGLVFESYDLSMLTAALKFIAADLAIAEADLGGYLGAIRLGALPGFLLLPFADRIGRRRVFLATLLGTSVGTFLTAFAQTPLQFVLAQMLTRPFLLMGAAVAAVMVTEEFPAEHRGWGVGMLGALGACGHGLGAVLFAAIEVLPYGWRALYVVGVAPVLLLPLFRREIRETARFERQRAARHARGEATGGFAGWHRPLVDLARTHPWRVVGVGLAAGLFALGDSGVFQFTGYFTQTVHGWSPAEYSAMVVVGGAVGIIGNVVAGRLGDDVGRRLVGAFFLALFPAAAMLFYHGPSWSVPVAWTLIVFCSTAAWIVLRTLSTELFPTSHRGTAAGWLTLVQTLGWAAGLQLVGITTARLGNMAEAIGLLSLSVLGGGAVLLLLPETRRRELETISSERDG